MPHRSLVVETGINTSSALMEPDFSVLEAGGNQVIRQVKDRVELELAGSARREMEVCNPLSQTCRT